MNQTAVSELTADRVNSAVNAILEALGTPQTDSQKTALEAFHAGNATLIKRLAVASPSDNFIGALGYLVSAPKLTPNTDTILRESAKTASAHVADRTLAQLGSAIYAALEQ
jgi:hypothetical protein